MREPENHSLMMAALREARVVSLGALIACAGGFFGKANEHVDGLGLAAPFLIPIVFCLLRVAMVPSPPQRISPLRRMLFQVFLAVALIVLLVFEIAVGQVAQFDKIAPSVLGFLTVLGGTYVLLYCLAHQFVPSDSLLIESDEVANGPLFAD